MISSRRNYRNNLEKLNLERKVDQFIEVSRRFVDGASGTRPGKRRNSFINESSRQHVNNVTNWVNNKVDSLFEDQDENEELDDWSDQSTKQAQVNLKTLSRVENSTSGLNRIRKRPLTAISLRKSEEMSLNKNLKRLKPSEEDWPESEVFQINRWKRDPASNQSLDLGINSEFKISGKGRNLPKSSRRRI